MAGDAQTGEVVAMKCRDVLIAGLLGLLSLADSGGALGATCETQTAAQLTNGRPVNAGVYLTAAQNCFGRADDDEPLAAKVRATLTSSDAPVETRVKRALQLLEAAVESLSPLEPVSARTEARTQLASAIAKVESSLAPGNPPLAPVEWDWSVATDLRAVPSLRLDGDLMAACAAGRNADDCKAGLSSANSWLRVAGLTRLTLDEYSKNYLVDQRELSARRLKMWHAYRDEGLPQFLWEYWINSAQMKHADKRQTGPDGKNPLGYEPIPTSQFIFLHPGASLEWRDAKQDTTDSNVKPALYVELFGVNRWSWDEKTGDMKGGKGISLVMSYANRDGAKSTGYGLMFHSRLTKQFTLGITRAGDDTALLINVDLAEYFKQKMGYWKKIQEKIDAGL
jgi:hypothetical protein